MSINVFAFAFSLLLDPFSLLPLRRLHLNFGQRPFRWNFAASKYVPKEHRVGDLKDEDEATFNIAPHRTYTHRRIERTRIVQDEEEKKEEKEKEKLGGASSGVRSFAGGSGGAEREGKADRK